ncbi:Liprin-beta-2, partial [Varanus komodoensis]
KEPLESAGRSARLERRSRARLRKFRGPRREEGAIGRAAAAAAAEQGASSPGRFVPAYLLPRLRVAKRERVGRREAALAVPPIETRVKLCLAGERLCQPPPGRRSLRGLRALRRPASATDSPHVLGLFTGASRPPRNQGPSKLEIMASDASHMLEAALEQMDDIIAGTKAAAEYTNGVYDMVSPAQSMYFGTLQILHLLEDLKLALEMVKDPQEREALRNQIPGTTAACIHDWLEENLEHWLSYQLCACVHFLKY